VERSEGGYIHPSIQLSIHWPHKRRRLMPLFISVPFHSLSFVQTPIPM
jgi:hypothetical protein